MNRIRYDSTGASKQSFTIGEHSYMVFLNKLDVSFEIRNVISRDVAAAGTAKTLAGLKSKAKATLVDMGYAFTPETRSGSVKGNAAITHSNIE